MLPEIHPQTGDMVWFTSLSVENTTGTPSAHITKRYFSTKVLTRINKKKLRETRATSSFYNKPKRRRTMQ